MLIIHEKRLIIGHMISSSAVQNPLIARASIHTCKSQRLRGRRTRGLLKSFYKTLKFLDLSFNIIWRRPSVYSSQSLFGGLPISSQQHSFVCQRFSLFGEKQQILNDSRWMKHNAPRSFFHSNGTNILFKRRKWFGPKNLDMDLIKLRIQPSKINIRAIAINQSEPDRSPAREFAAQWHTQIRTSGFVWLSKPSRQFKESCLILTLAIGSLQKIPDILHSRKKNTTEKKTEKPQEERKENSGSKVAATRVEKKKRKEAARSMHLFLYPSEEDMYKLVRFFVIRLSQTSESIEFAESHNIHAGADNAECNRQITSKVCLETTAHYWISEFLGNNDVFSVGKPNNKADAVSEIMDQNAIPGSFPGILSISKDSGGNNDIRQLIETLKGSRRKVCQIEDKKGDVYDFPEFVERSSSFQELPSEELETMKDARKMWFGGKNLVDFQQNNEGNCRGALQDNNALLLKSLHLSNPGPQGKVQRLKDIELETESVLFEIRNSAWLWFHREEECVKLTADFEKQRKFASRRTYVERISEITKNSRKQDTDIESIFKETREIQLESNSLEERLHRSYAVVDEMVFREAKKDIVSHELHRLLTSIHHNFAEIRGKKLETERTRREVVNIEGELSTLASRSFRMEKLQTDLDAIKWENDCLERQLHDALYA
ncbi:hypothetical protein V2J09_010997 [Rumex salicifolius]